MTTTTIALSGDRPRFLEGERLLLLFVVAYVGLFSVLPLGRLMAEAFLPQGRLGFDLVIDVLSSRSAVRATVNTLEASLGATLVSLLLGAAAALVVSLSDVRFKPLLVFLLLMPMLIPAQIAALSWLELMGPSSPLLAPLGLVPAPGSRNPLYSREGIILLMGIEHSTIVFLSVRAGLRSLPREALEAAQAAGAGPLRIVRDVVLPMIRPAMVAGCALAFVSSIGNFGIPALLGIPGRYTMLTTLIYQRLNGFGPSILGEVGALALILAVMAAAGLAVQALAMRGHRAAANSGDSPRPFRLGRWRPAVESALWSVLLFITILPLIALAATAMVKALGVPLSWETATLDHFRFVLFEYPSTQRAFVNSCLLSAAAAVGAVAVAIPLGHALVRRPTPLIRVLDVLADAPFALPGIVLSIACIMVYLKPLPVIGIGFYGTFGIILFAYLGRFLSLGLRPTVAGLRQIDPALEEAARIAGAGPVRRLFTVVLPLAAAGGDGRRGADLHERAQRTHGFGAVVVVGLRNPGRDRLQPV